MSGKVEIDVTQRGFQLYDAPWRDTYGTKIAVHESSAASGPHCWVRFSNEGGQIGGNEEVAAHLNVEQAKKLRRELKAFIDESKVRWSE